MPSAVPHRVPQRAEHATQGRLRVGWIGGAKNLSSIKPIEEALRRAASRHDFILTIISNEGYTIDGVEAELVPWSLERQEAEVAKLDVGIMPLEDSPWSRGKCAYKGLQYMAAGVPVIASRVGMNTEVIRSGENGLLVGNTEEWVEALDRLLSDASLREALGGAGRRTVEADYTYDVLAKRLADFLRSVA